ncbi:hypothetical protein B0H66DRAFT_602136 [Apodospora peruviana]|uniref:Rhodopsin domain-containing protein n=1 Tax=Apodospora peruviana TaxID=516989 RepID=A0AAE0ICR0_9PEZI|nr:hypothetical protein B0H66DRAFT_602136 [Apodospora peruviana]
MGQIDPTALALCTVFPFLSIVAVIARFRARAIKRVKLGADDWVVLPALIFSLGNVANILYGAIKADLGQHMPLDGEGFAVNGPKLTALNKMTYVTPILGSVGLGCSRWSVLLLYNRIFGAGRFRYAVYVLSALNIGWIVSFVFVFIFRCFPISEVWTSQQGQRKHCIGIESNYGYAVSSVILDLMVLSMPWPMIWRMHMDLKTKLATTGIFMLGAIVTAAGIGKIYAFYTVGALIAKNHDLTYDEAPLFYWTVPELCLAVVCACLPILRPIVHGLTPSSVFSSIRGLVSFGSLKSLRTMNSNKSLNSENEKSQV